MDVGHDPVLFADLEEVLPQLPGAWLRLVVRRDRVVGVVLQVVDPKLRLQLRRVVGLLDPGGAPHLSMPVVHYEVRDPLLEEAQGLPEAAVPGADDAVRVGVRLLLAPEALDPVDGHVSADLLHVEVLPDQGPLPEVKSELARLYPELEREDLLHLDDLGVRVHGDGELLVGPEDLQDRGPLRQAGGVVPDALWLESPQEGRVAGSKRHGVPPTARRGC
mmetsp:Transcript_23164/g.64715  ORF Transcript_23164/g.64715 Transcript_23164/m.64715 type:complete len:219 (+) Transcript_23164:1520-2176(+)